MPMRTIGRYESATRNLKGDLIVSFAVKDEAVIKSLEAEKDKELVIETKKYNEKRSLNANAYFWVLCDKIAQVLRTTKEAVYLVQLSHYGVFLDVQIPLTDLPVLKRQFRYVEEFTEPFSDVTVARCYLGSSTYDKAQMGRLIDGTVEDAKELGIDTWTPEEIARALASWEGER